MMESPAVLAAIGGAVVAIIGFFLKSFGSSLVANIQKSLTSEQEEREKAAILTLRGQQVIAHCLHETMYAVINGEHNGGLAEADSQLKAFTEQLNQFTAERAIKRH